MGYLTNSERKLRARSSFAKEDAFALISNSRLTVTAVVSNVSTLLNFSLKLIPFLTIFSMLISE